MKAYFYTDNAGIRVSISSYDTELNEETTVEILLDGGTDKAKEAFELSTYTGQDGIRGVRLTAKNGREALVLQDALLCAARWFDDRERAIPLTKSISCAPEQQEQLTLPMGVDNENPK